MKKNGVFFLMIILAVEMVWGMDNPDGYYNLLTEDSLLPYEDIFPVEILEPIDDFAPIALGMNLVNCTMLKSSQESLLIESPKQDKKRKVKTETNIVNKKAKQEQHPIFKRYIFSETRGDLELHEKKRDIRYGFKCLECSESFPAKQKKLHETWHLAGGNACHYCKVSCQFPYELKKHAQTSRCKKKQEEFKLMKKKVVIPVSNALQEEQAFLVCSKGCGYKTPLNKSLKKHERIDHTRLRVCIYCKDENKYLSRGALLQHIDIEHPVSNVCSYGRCGFYSTRKETMRVHQIPKVHAKLHACEDCGVLFSSMIGRRQHYEVCKIAN